jgi:hypothetical protein
MKSLSFFYFLLSITHILTGTSKSLFKIVTVNKDFDISFTFELISINTSQISFKVTQLLIADVNEWYAFLGKCRVWK